MRHLRLVLPALAFVVAGTWSGQAVACDKEKATRATATTASSEASEMSAQCTPEMMAACKAKGAKTRKAAFTASNGSCASKSAATTAALDHCAGKGAKTSAVTAAMTSDHCATKGARTSAVTASKSSKTTLMLAGAGGSCGTKSRKASTTAAGSSCSGHGMATMAGRNDHEDCDACADMAMCYDQIESAGVRTQVVPLKNGVMFVYTAESSGNANVVQTAMARRSERLVQIVNAGDKARLCGECKTLRGAMASGKLNREVVNIEGGALTLMTSTDATVVAKIHNMVEQHKSARTKS